MKKYFQGSHIKNNQFRLNICFRNVFFQQCSSKKGNIYEKEHNFKYLS